MQIIFYQHRFIILILFFIIISLAPFLPAILELYRKKDIKALSINMDYYRDPSYLGESFVNILINSLTNSLHTTHLDNIRNGYYDVNLSSPEKEKIYVFNNSSLDYTKVEINYLLVCKNNFTVVENARFYKEIYVNGDFKNHGEVACRSMFVGGNAYLKGKLKFDLLRWLHVNKNLYIESPSHLGINVYCKERLLIKNVVFFNRMFASEISVNNNMELIDDFADPSIQKIVFVKHSLKTNNMVNIKNKNKLIIIDGDVFSEKDINIDGNIWVKGNVFSQGSISLKNGVVIGQRGYVKSVVAREKIQLMDNVKLYGSIVAGRGGQCLQ